MSKISYKQFKECISLHKIDKAYFLYGSEKYLVKQAENAIVKISGGEKKSEFDFISIEGDKINMDDLSMYINTYPVSSKRKCAVIHDMNIESLDADSISDFVYIISDIPDFSTLIISQSSLEFDAFKSAKWKKFLDNISKEVSIVEFSQKDITKPEEQIISWAKLNGKDITYRLANMIIRRCGKDLNNLKNEVDKLCCFENDRTIKESSIKSIITESIESNAFSMCNSLLSGNYSDMYKRLDVLFDNNENPVLILSAIATNYIDMFRVKAAIDEGLDPYGIKEYFDYKKKEFKIDAAVKNSSKMSMEQIKESICVLTLADEELKSFSIDPKIILNFYIAKLIQIKERKV